MDSRLATLTLLLMTHTIIAGTYYVSPQGNDEHPGTRAKPFKTIQKAADVAAPGDTCSIQGGVYRETVTLGKSGLPGKPICFVAAGEGPVIINGTEPVAGPWEKHRDRIWKASLPCPQIEQLFVDDVMQNEARWPDMPFEKRWDRAFWGKVGKASEYGKLEVKGLAATGVDWTGGIAMLNVGHQFFTWTRDITSHQKGTDFITYDRDLPGLAFLDPNKGKKLGAAAAQLWRDDYFYLFGKLEALTASTEWFHDPEEGVIYYMPEGEQAPRNVTVKARDYGIIANGIEHVVFKGIHFMGCAFEFKGCRCLSLTDCHLVYPGYRRRIVGSEQKQYKAPYPMALLGGLSNRMERCSIQYAGGTALLVRGNNNTLENSIVRDGCWSGTLRYPLVKIHGENNIIRRNTISQSGSPLVKHNGPNIIELNRIFNGGILSEDVSGVYTQGSPDGEHARGAIVRYNWVHGVRTGHGLGQGIRGDDMTRGLIVHHNVVWDCGMTGIIIKGGENHVFNNTIFDVSNGKACTKRWRDAGLIVPTQPEPRKPWKPYHELNIYLDVQNADSIIANNLVDDIFFRVKKIDAPGIQANFEVGNRIRHYLVDPDNRDFRLKPSALDELPEAMKVPSKEDRISHGSYLGAYDPGLPAWKPGADWSL